MNTLLATPWNYRQSWNDGLCSYDGHTIFCEYGVITVTDYIKQRYLSPVWFLNQLSEHWQLLGAIALFLSDGSAASTQELSQALGVELSAISNAVELGFTIGWFEVSDKVSLIFLEEKCDNSTYAPALVQVLELQDSRQDENLWVSVKPITTVQTSFQNDSPVSPTTETCEAYQLGKSENRELMSSPLPHPVNHFQSTVNDLVQPTSETVSPPLNVPLNQSDPSSLLSKTSPDCSVADSNQEVKLSISSSFLDKLPSSATMRNGFVYAQETLAHPSLENDYFWLESPAALSSTGKTRPPGQSKLETQLKKLGLLPKGEVLNPVILSDWYDIPKSWLDPLESRPATALLENKDRQQEIFLTPELHLSLSPESSTSQLSPELVTTEKFLEESLSTDKSRACGCLYQYIENKKLKDGRIASYPRVDGTRDKHNYLHWRWGYSWEEKIDGQWKNRSVGVPAKIAHTVATMISKGYCVREIKNFITLSKNKGKSNK
ncbi:DNA methylase [Sphaerospermopsis kisseleviana CS-549]|uniref:C-5 cytosine-specific DNA methylase n=2 Tax=Sphaerospermopsis TaxID=752201 RepID=A0A479ZW02_9CYAN|nr:MULTISPECIES: DNA methylase [Sphaerospermopsis]MDB9442057.1 DNA methylase [Sphaerospermopsis kisseleviana CS-549]BAZ83814.1 C-5 cytosine-specific DNA methylase [Sphaerospermopsis kisseleviana NIES-73]GCL35756.1 C-5 cytosine-specific DNA methylase [Sphaerospermopsis reniformis]